MRFTTPFTFIAREKTIALMKIKPIFVDIEGDIYNIDAIQVIADKHELKIIIDGAQIFGSTYKDKTDSSLGDISTTSFFPVKSLDYYGDGGALFTNNDDYAEK